MNLSGFHKHIVKRYHPFIKNVRNKKKQKKQLLHMVVSCKNSVEKHL